MSTSFRPAWTIAWREVRDQVRDWRIAGPVVLLAVIFPYLVNYSSGRFINFAQSNGATLGSQQLSPFLLMVVGFFPLSVSLVVALESFVGEKERRTLEPLLSSPLSDLQLFLGKLLAVTIPPLLVSYLGMSVYLLGAARGADWLPNGIFLAQIYFLTTVNGMLMVSAAVVVSAQATSMRAANLLAAFIILPMSVLLLGQSIVIVRNDIPVLWWTILGELVVVILLVRTGVSHFNREELLGRELDSLDLRGGWYTFWDAFLGEASTPLEWYRHEIGLTLRRLALPLVLVTAGLALGMLLGANLAGRYAFPPELFRESALNQGAIEGFDSIRFFEVGSVPLIWMHNLRVILTATVLGVFTFGVLAMVLLLAPMLLIGYFAASIAVIGISPWVFMAAFVLPHGVLEVPAILLAGAAILRLGATLVAPTGGRSIGEVWLGALADWTRVMIALVIPLLLGAAVLEVLVTPKVAQLIFGG